MSKYLKQLALIFAPFVVVGLEVYAETKSVVKGVIAWLIAMILFLGFWSAIIIDMSNEQPVNIEPAIEERQEEPQEQSDKRLVIESPKPSPKQDYTLSPGNYIAGKDFAPGLYDITAVKGNGNVFSDEGFASLNLMLGTDNEFFDKSYKNAEIKKGVKLTIERVTIKLVAK